MVRHAGHYVLRRSGPVRLLHHVGVRIRRHGRALVRALVLLDRQLARVEGYLRGLVEEVRLVLYILRTLNTYHSDY